MVKIVSDTLSCIPVQKAAELGIPYLPQIIIFGEESYRDDTEMTQASFLEKLKSSSVLPKTAAPPPHLYIPIFQEAQDNGEGVLVICPSAELSGTVRGAEVAAKDFPGLDVRVIDTRTIAGGLGSIVINALEWAKQGLSIDAIEKNVKEISARNRIYFMVDTLEFLRRGGRIGGAAALIGSLLQVKPILMLKNGRIEPEEKQRTYKKAFSRIQELAASQAAPGAESMLSVMHGASVEEAQRMAEELSITLGLPQIPIYDLPPAVLVHSGPGALAISFFVAE